jgi:hypothetical protein
VVAFATPPKKDHIKHQNRLYSMSNTQKQVLLALPPRFLNLSVEYGAEPEIQGVNAVQKELGETANEQEGGKLRILDLITLQPDLFKPLLDEQSTTDSTIVQAFENGLPDSMALRTNLVSFFWLTGTTFKDVKTSIAALKDAMAQESGSPLLQLKADPNNAYDPFCIIVSDEHGNRLGYVPRKDQTNQEVLKHLKEPDRLVAVQIAMIEDGRKGSMLAAACGWQMPPEILNETESAELPADPETKPIGL